jgi:3-oxoacyl-[acyl-carrier protein] reductase
MADGCRSNAHVNGTQKESLNMKKLSNRVAVITGGAQGLGKAIALAMANEGANIVICDINAKTLPDAQAEIEATGVRCLPVQCDVSSVESVANLFRQAVSELGTVDILVNNAALLQTGARNEEMRTKFYKMMTTPVAKESLGVTKDFTDEEWHKYWAVNVHGVFYCTREALRIMEPKKSGKIINISSIAGIGGLSAFHPAYCATKGAVLAFTRSVAIEVAGANIFVNAIAAGGILTPPMEKFLAEAPEETRNSLHQIVPLGRLGRPEEYASLAVYLASDGHYLVGQTISPNGGQIL